MRSGKSREFSASLCALVAILCTSPALAQGSIRGTVRSGGTGIAGAPVQAKNVASGVTVRTFSDADGDYSLEGLPTATYTLSVRMPGFKYLPFVRSVVVAEPTDEQRADIELAIGNLDTLGDDPYTYLLDLRESAATLTGPARRTADGHPDLSGVWFGKDDLFPEEPALLPWAAMVVQNRLAADLKDLPRGQCLPAGVLPLGPFFWKFVHTPELLVVLNEDDVLGFRQIFLDGRRHSNELLPSWQGHSVGRWEGDVLVVDSVGFNTSSVIGIAPHTEQLHLTERYHRRDFGHMDVEIAVEDPGALARTWTIRMVWDLAPDQELNEFVCGEHILNMQLQWRADFHLLREQVLRSVAADQ